MIKEGDKGDLLYVVEDGKLDCFKLIEGEQKKIKEYEPGEAFGELALLYNAPRENRQYLLICRSDGAGRSIIAVIKIGGRG